MQTVGIPEFQAILTAIARIMEEKKDELIRLDGAVGDGDLGLTMEKAFAAARDDAAASAETELSKFLMRVGMTIARSAPSTMGTLVATGFMSGAKALGAAGSPAPSSLGPKEMAVFLEAFVGGIMQRGKSKPGEKTIVDVLHPAARALREAADAGENLPTAFEKCLAAAQDGLVRSRDMIAQHGRVAYYQEQSKGKEDPGAVAANYIIQGFAAAISGG